MVKKYFIGSFAALLTVGFMTSCSHDDVYDASQDMDVLKYEAAFKAKFGEPAPDQDWGFGISRGTRAVSTYTGVKGTMTPVYTFPTDAPASKFLASVPGGVEKLPADGNVKGGTYYIDATTTKVNMYEIAGIIYVSGICDMSESASFEVAQNTQIYLIENSQLILNAKDAAKLKAKVYIASGATLKTSGRLKMDNTSEVYNHGTIDAGSFEVNNTSILYNVGELKVSGEVYLANSNSAIVNDGTITGDSLNTAGSSHFLNNAEVELTGNTTINSNNNTWVNNGYYHTGNYIYTAGSNDVINNCRLKVDELFNIYIGDVWPQDRANTINKGFRMDAGSGVETKNFLASGPMFINMGPRSVFKVTNTATMNITKDVYGIYGPESGDYAVFQAKDIVNGAANSNQGFVANYFNNVYVVADTHFSFGYSNVDPSQWETHVPGQWDQPYYRVADGAALYTNGVKPEYTITPTVCNPGFGGGDPDEFVPVIRVMAEDLSAKEGSDFDFNDVVFDVMWIDGGAKIRLMAAGGTLPLTIEGQEVHELFKEKTQAMINTIENDRSHEPVIFTITGDFKTDGVNDANKISVKVYKNDQWKELTAVKGKVASKIGVDPKVDWQKEWNDIEDLYPDFGAWVRGEVDLFY